MHRYPFNANLAKALQKTALVECGRRVHVSVITHNDTETTCEGCLGAIAKRNAAYEKLGIPLDENGHAVR